MLKTITIGSCISVQGTFVRSMPDGRISVQVDNTVFSGVPVTKK
jgi:hypothetical protein